MFITITLTTPVGSSVGPFDLFSNADSYAAAFDTNIPLSTLLSGYTIELPMGATIVRVQSLGTCTNYIDLPVNCTTTTTTTTIAPTTTTTTTTTIAPTTNCILYQIGTSSASAIPYSYIDCEGNEGGGILGGVGGFDSDTFCAQEGSVDSGGMTLVDQGPCETPTSTTTTTTTIAPTTTTTTTTVAPTTTTTTTVVDCNCITVGALDTQLTSGGQDLYYILNSCSGGNIDINLNNTPGTEIGGSTYFGLCSSGPISDLFKYGPGGDSFEGLPGMTVASNETPCSENINCVPVIPS